MVRARSVLIALLLPLVLLGTTPANPVVGADEAEPGSLLGTMGRAIFDVFTSTPDIATRAAAQSRRNDRLCGAVRDDPRAADACQLLLRYRVLERELARAERRFVDYRDRLMRIAVRADDLLRRAETEDARHLLKYQRISACGDVVSIKSRLRGLAAGLHVQRLHREYLATYLPRLDGRRLFFEVRDLLDEIDDARIQDGLQRVSDLSGLTAAAQAEVQAFCDQLEEDLSEIDRRAAEQQPLTHWRLVEPKPKRQSIELATGFDGSFDPEDDRQQLDVSYETQWLDENHEYEDVKYEIEGSFTTPPERLRGGEKLQWSISGSMKGSGSAPVRIFLCYKAKGISSRLPDRCAVFGLPTAQFERQSQITEVTFEVPKPAKPDDRLVVTVNAGTMARLDYVYEPAAE